MDQISYILVNPSFATNSKSTFALVSNEKTIGSSIKYFWSELARKSFKFTDQDTIYNFPMCIYDKESGIIRTFVLDQYTTENNDMIKFKYNELLQNDINQTLSNIAFDNYYNRLIDNFIINLDVSNFRNNKTIACPPFKKKFFLRI